MKERVFKVFVAKTSENVIFYPLYPPEKQEEISACGNLKVKRQKYFGWLLLKKAYETTYGLPFSDLKFTKTKNGKWLSDKFFFSISHSGEYVAVSLDNRPIGLDIQIIEPEKLTKRLFDKISTDREKEVFNGYDVTDVCALFTEKEAVFKAFGGDAFIPRKIETGDYPIARTIETELNLCVSVCYGCPERAKLTVEMVQLS